jgi:thiamine pyrophosphokinase
MKAAIVCNGNIADYNLCKQRLRAADVIICADGGVRHTFEMNVMPDIILGDMDSAKAEYIDYYKKQVPIVQFNRDKSKTDTQLCLEYALERYDDILILGATGTRLDHTLGNISLLKLAADLDKKACIADENNEICVIKDHILLEGSKEDILSLLPLGSKVEGITLTGVYYPLENAVMEIGNPYGISNRFKENKAELSIKSGYLLVIKSRD